MKFKIIMLFVFFKFYMMFFSHDSYKQQLFSVE